MSATGKVGTRTLLGFDYGQVRIGVAIAQELTVSARPLLTLTIQSHHNQPPWEKISDIIAEWRPQLLVVGVAYQADGTASHVTRAALQFAQQLKQHTQLPVSTIDERLSSYAAESLLTERSSRQGKRQQPQKYDKAAIDRVAAALILETWLQQQDPNFI